MLTYVLVISLILLLSVVFFFLIRKNEGDIAVELTEQLKPQWVAAGLAEARKEHIEDQKVMARRLEAAYHTGYLHGTQKQPPMIPAPAIPLTLAAGSGVVVIPPGHSAKISKDPPHRAEAAHG